MPANLEKSSVATGLEKVSFPSNPKERQCQRMFKLQCNCNFIAITVPECQIYKLDLEEAEEPEIKLPTSARSWKKTREFQKNIYFCFIDYAKAFDCVDHNKLWKILRDGDTRPLYLSSENLICKTRSKS